MTLDFEHGCTRSMKNQHCPPRNFEIRQHQPELNHLPCVSWCGTNNPVHWHRILMFISEFSPEEQVLTEASGKYLDDELVCYRSNTNVLRNKPTTCPHVSIKYMLGPRP